MMKSFFKKLAFVMALAMVVSMAAPAGSALAAGLSVAYQNGGAVSELNVKAGAEQDLKFLGAPKNWKDLGFAWTSSNEAVATVDQAGLVTAVADGTATITITVGDLTGSVVVNVGEAKAYDVTLGNADNKAMTAADLKEGASLDLNFYGVKDWNKDNYTVAWSVSGDAANVDKNGVVTAVKAGKAVVTASIVNNLTGVAHKVAPVEVTVAGSVNPDSFTVAQKDTDKFVLTFATAKTADAIKENLTVSVKIGDQDFPISFENVTVDGTTATVTTYANFENEEVYTLTFGKEVVAHTIVLGDIATVGAKYYTGKNPENVFAYVTEEEESDYVTFVPVLFDQYGNDITAKYDVNNFSFTYEVSSNVAPACVYNDTYAFDAAGVATVTVTAAWVTDAGDYKEATGKTSFQVLKRGTVGLTLVKSGLVDTDNVAEDDDINDTAKAPDDKFTYYTSPKTSFQLDPNSKLWSSASNTVMYKTDDTRDIVYSAVLKDNRGNVITTNTSDYKFGYFIYESTNSEVLTVADTTGEVEVNGTGKANVLVYFVPADGTDSKKLVASTLITVTPETYPVSYKMTTALATKASHVIDEDLNDGEFKVQFYDQNGKTYRNDELINLITIEARDSKNLVGILADPTWEAWSGNYVFKIDASAFKADLGDNNSKTYSYKLTVDEADLTEKIKTPYAVFSMVVKNTADDCAKIADYLSTGYVAPNYKFNIGFSGNQNVDIAVKNVQDYTAKNETSRVKHTWWSTEVKVKYLSTGNLELAHVPTSKLVNINAGGAKLTTGDVGFVYYKISAPSKTTVAGVSVANDAWKNENRAGVVDFYFNKENAATPEIPGDLKLVDDDGNEIKFQVLTEDRDQYTKKNNIYLPEKYTALQNAADYSKGAFDVTQTPIEDGVEAYYDKAGGAGDFVKVTFVRGESIPAKEASFKYAATGNYTVSFYTTRKDNTAFNNIATRTIAISNSQSQVKYLGLNPEFNGVTETYDDLNASNLVSVVREQLRFSYEDLFIGDFYDTFDGYGMNIELSAAQPKVHFANDGKSVTITALYFDVTLDDGSETYTYTSVVSVGARIKVK